MFFQNYQVFKREQYTWPTHWPPQKFRVAKTSPSSFPVDSLMCKQVKLYPLAKMSTNMF